MTDSAPPPLPVLLLRRGGPAPVRPDALSRWRADLGDDARPLAWLRNGFLLPPADPPAGAVLYDAGAACACCTGLLPMRLTLARLLRDATRRGGWAGVVVELGPHAHPDAVMALLASPPFGERLAVPWRVGVEGIGPVD